MGSGEGSTRARLESVARQTGKVPKELEELAELPESMRYVWKYFLDLNRKRSNGMGLGPITYSEMLAYFTLNRIAFDEAEIQLLDLLDGIALEHFSEENKKNSNKNKSKNNKKTAK